MTILPRIKSKSYWQSIWSRREQQLYIFKLGEAQDAFLVITGKSISDSKAPFALYEWSGNADGAMRPYNVGFAKKMKPEGIVRGAIGGKSALVIVDDNGGFQVVWADQQLPFVGSSRATEAAVRWSFA